MNPTNAQSDSARRWGAVAKYAAILGVGFVVAPYVFTAITGLFGLLIAGVLILGTWMVLPSVEAAAANLRLKLIKAEAAKNPVETLQNAYREEVLVLAEREKAVQRLNGQVRTFADKVSAIATRYGPNDPSYIKLSGDLKGMRQLAENRVLRLREARDALVKKAEAIQRASMIWDAAQAATAAQESSGLSEAEFFTQLRTETAIDAIQNSYNEALASLDTMLDIPRSTPIAADIKPEDMLAAQKADTATSASASRAK